jgi:hypothetical protein
MIYTIIRHRRDNNRNNYGGNVCQKSEISCGYLKQKEDNVKTGETVRNGGNGNFMINAGHRYSRNQAASDTLREYVG